MLKVVEVVVQARDHLVDGVRIAVVERGVGGHAGAYLVEEGVARVALHDLVDVELPLGPRADEGHVAAEDVPQLRQLVEVMLAQELADARQALVAALPVELWPGGLGVERHRAELVDVERASEAADALLPEQGRAAVLAAHRDVAEEEER